MVILEMPGIEPRAVESRSKYAIYCALPLGINVVRLTRYASYWLLVNPMEYAYTM